MKVSKRVIAAVLSLCMIVSSAGMNVQAYNEENMQAAPAVLKDENEEGLLGEITRDEPEEVSETEQPEDSGETTDTGIKESEDLTEAPDSGIEQLEDSEKTAEAGILNFIMQESSYIQTPGVQNVAASLGEEGSTIEQAVLHYRNTETGQEFTAEAVGIVDNMVRFSMEYASEEQAGIYELESITYQKDGRLYQVTLAELNMKVVYGVDREVEAEPDDLLLDEDLLNEVEANVVTMDENGNTVSENSVENILESAQTTGKASLSRNAVTQGTKNLVVVLDPGHDSTHAGAAYNGYQEQDLVLKIALYCKAELQKYSGVKVYMTRETKDCANGGSSVDSATCNARRVEFAKSKGADVYVSFHLNASTSNASGVGVYYPNGSYRPDIGEEGKGLAWKIYQKLSALGLSTWAGGILIRNSENNTLYPDGSLADYLAVIRRSKEAGFPAVLIEHAFLSSAWDVNNFLNSDDKLKNLGVADAKGIAEFYDLSLKGNTPEISWIQSRSSQKLRIRWEPVTDAVSYQIYRSTSRNGTYSRIATVKEKNIYDDSKVNIEETYYYKVRAVYSDGKKSVYSKVHMGKTIAAAELTGVVSRSGGKIKLSWNQVNGADQYEILRSESKNKDYQIIAAVGANKNSYVDGNIKTQKTYYYRIRVRGGEKNGYSSYSKVLSGWAIKGTKITSVSSQTSTSLQIKWKKVVNAYAYRIQRSTSKNGTYKTIATVKASKGISYVDTKVKAKKKYYYRVQAINRVNGTKGYSEYSKPLAGATITATSITYVMSKGTGKMEIKWKKDPNAYGYRIKRSTSLNGTYKRIADVKGKNSIKYVDESVQGGKRYYYAVETIVKKGNVKNYSGNSKVVSAINMKQVTVDSMQVQTAGLQLTWKKVSGANGYQIMRSDSAKGPFKEVTKIRGGSVTSYTDTQIKTGERYYYKIRALKTGKYTGYGSYTKALEKWVLAAPKSLKVSAIQPDQMKVTWKKVSKASGYKVLRSTKKNSGYEVIATLSGASKVTYTDQTVLPGKTYYYKVAATASSQKVVGAGDETAPVSGKTTVAVSAIESVEETQEQTLMLKLKKVSGAYGYEIQRSVQAESGYETVGTLEDGTVVFTDQNVANKTTYYYRVRTIWMIAGEKYYSSYSEVKSGSVK